jgi:hypothetical protein
MNFFAVGNGAAVFIRRGVMTVIWSQAAQLAQTSRFLIATR